MSDEARGRGGKLRLAVGGGGVGGGISGGRTHIHTQINKTDTHTEARETRQGMTGGGPGHGEAGHGVEVVCWSD